MYYDCVIVGGGAVGASLALALSQLKYHVLLLEKKTPHLGVQDIDARTLALSYSSYHILQTLGVWEQLAQRAVPIQKVHVSIQGKFGSCRLDCQQQKLNALGYVVGFDDLEMALYQQLGQMETAKVLRPATIQARESSPWGWTLSIATPTQTDKIRCRLLVAADGVDSLLREEQSIPFRKKGYGHFAIMNNVRILSHQSYIATERFLDQGAIALLPWREGYATCIWTMDKVQAQKLTELNDEKYMQICQHQLGGRIGKLQAIGKRVSFPLLMRLATQQISSRFLLMGNSAHSLHPIAAQGLNLSLRDIWQIRSQILKAKEFCDIGSTSFLSEYVKLREDDQDRVIFATDKIARFMSGGPLPTWLRALGITLFDCLTPLKRQFTHLSMGLS